MECKLLDMNAIGEQFIRYCNRKCQQ